MQQPCYQTSGLVGLLITFAPLLVSEKCQTLQARHDLITVIDIIKVRKQKCTSSE